MYVTLLEGRHVSVVICITVYLRGTPREALLASTSFKIHYVSMQITWINNYTLVAGTWIQCGSFHDLEICLSVCPSVLQAPVSCGYIMWLDKRSVSLSLSCQSNVTAKAPEIWPNFQSLASVSLSLSLSFFWGGFVFRFSDAAFTLECCFQWSELQHQYTLVKKT